MNWELLCNSLIVASGATALAVAVGFFAALWCVGTAVRWQRLFWAVAIAALVLPPFLVTNCWIDLLGQTGLWRRWLSFNIYSLGGTVWILALLTWPISFFFVLAAWRRVEAAQLEVDSMLRGGYLLRWLLLPMARSSLLQASVLTFVLTLNNFAVPAILQVKVFPAELWVNFNTTFDYVAALKICWPMILVPLLAIVWLHRSEVAWNWRSDSAPAKTFRRQIGLGWWIGSGVIALLAAIASVAVPCWQLVFRSATWNELWPALAAGQSALLHSAGFAAATAAVVILLALATWRWPLQSVLWLPFLTPGVLLGIALIWALNRPGLGAIYQSVVIVVLAYGIRYAVLGWNCVARAARGTDRTLSDAARLEGANGWQMLRHVYWPQIAPQVAVGWYVTYLLCLWDVETLVLIVPPGEESAALRIFNLLHYGHNVQVNALCVLLLGLALLPLILWRGLQRCARGRNALKLLVPALVLTGCSDSQQAGKFPVQSQFFSQVQIIGTRSTGLGQFNKPRSVAVDAQDNLYVIDMTGRMQKFSPEGEFLDSWQMPQTEKGKPKGMCRDGVGNIVLVEPHYTRVNHFSPDGKLVAQWGVNGTNVGQLAFPRGVAVNSRNEIYISEYSLVERIQHFSALGKEFLGSFGKPGDKRGEMNRVEGLGIDSKDQVYAADSCNHRIQVFTAEGRFLRTYGKAGGGVGEMSYPYDVKVDAAGFQYVCEFGNSRIQIFDAADHSVEILGRAGGNPGQFSNPWSICLDSKGNLYVADSQNHRVQKFLRKGGKS